MDRFVHFLGNTTTFPSKEQDIARSKGEGVVRTDGTCAGEDKAVIANGSRKGLPAVVTDDANMIEIVHTCTLQCLV